MTWQGIIRDFMVWCGPAVTWWPYGGLVISSNFYILIWLGMLEHGNTIMASSYDMTWYGLVCLFGHVAMLYSDMVWCGGAHSIVW